MFGIGSTELVIILVFGFLLFGPDKLPQMGRTIGRALRQFRETQEKMTSVVQSEVIDPMAAVANAPVKPKKSGMDATGATADTDDLDADIADSAIDNQPRRKETFAERRARLAAEKAEKDAASKGATASEGAEGAVNAEGAGSAAAAAEQASEPATDHPVAEPGAEEEPAVRTTADLYARRPRKHKAVSKPAAGEGDAPANGSSAEGGER